MMEAKFNSEAVMARKFKIFLDSWASSSGFSVINELPRVLGIPDYLLFRSNKKSITYAIAIELKRNNWRRGLLQAFKYKIFTNESYVVIDDHYLRPALKNAPVFRKANVGLASFSTDSKFYIHITPNPSRPFSEEYAGVMARVVSDLTKKKPTSLSPLFANEALQRHPFNSLILKF